MEYRLNLFLKSFGLNATPSVTFFPKNGNEIKKLIEGYQNVLRGYQLYKYENEIKDNVFIQKRTEIHKHDILNMILKGNNE